MKVAYIVGLGRSGSTLLDLLLNAHSQVFTVGEVKELWLYAHMKKKPRQKPRGYWTNGSRCTCQAQSIWECDFWQGVNRRLEENDGVSLADLDVESNDDDRFRQDNARLFQAVGEESGARVVVDSSKGLRRLRRLMEIPELEVVPIHMVRNPWGRANSVRKDRFKVFSPAIQYSYNAFRVYGALASTPHPMLRYEDLIADPEGQLRPLMEALGLDFEAGQLEWAEQQSHNIGGNRMRQGGDSTLRLDTSWKNELSLLQKAGVGLFSLPGRLVNSAKEKRLEKSRE